ncbi:DNA-protecting protein DprA [Cytobacillus suaedae]|nr:DNA-protecting protein DprA [Cytobacillus suaedae]
MKNARERLIHLHHCRGVSWKGIATLLKYDPSLDSLYSLSHNFVESLLTLSKPSAQIFLKDLHSIEIQSMLKQYNEQNIHLITIFDQTYPNHLKQIFDPPWVLYAKGDLSILHEKKQLSVVGTRLPSAYGYHCMEKLIVPLIEKQWCIVSGMAEGIDTSAHQIAIDNGGKTIAIIGSGFNYIYPKSNLKLVDMIIQKHLLLSEYPPNTKPQRWHFPMRNRIISGMTKGTIVVEAKDRSGSLITADQALQQGREVFAVPGSILSNTSTGTNKLIQQGAKLVLSHIDILEELEEVYYV